MTDLKPDLSQLAVLGGPPLFDAPIHVGRPNIGNRERLLARINEMLDRRWLSNHGPFVQEFESKVADFLGVRHCIAMCNGTVALEIAIRATGMRGEVIVPSFTFIATAHARNGRRSPPYFATSIRAPPEPDVDVRRRSRVWLFVSQQDDRELRICGSV
jgi:hypothetical protein